MNLQAHAESATPHSTPPKNFEFVQISRPTPGRGRAGKYPPVPNRGYATGGQTKLLTESEKFFKCDDDFSNDLMMSGKLEAYRTDR